MNRINALVAGLLVYFLVPAVCFSGTIQKPSQEVGKLPDLTVAIEIEKEDYIKPDGTVCYGLQPVVTVTNNGKSSAQNFRVKLEWKQSGQSRWKTIGYRTNNSLGPGKSKTFEPDTIEKRLWCENDLKKAGFRVTADDQGIVAETKENNNTATIMFPNFKIKRQ